MNSMWVDFVIEKKTVANETKRRLRGGKLFAIHYLTLNGWRKSVCAFGMCLLGAQVFSVQRSFPVVERQAATT